MTQVKRLWNVCRLRSTNIDIQQRNIAKVYVANAKNLRFDM